MYQKGLAAGGQSLIQLNGELGRVTSELAEIGQLKTTTTVEVRGKLATCGTLGGSSLTVRSLWASSSFDKTVSISVSMHVCFAQGCFLYIYIYIPASKCSS